MHKPWRVAEIAHEAIEFQSRVLARHCELAAWLLRLEAQVGAILGEIIRPCRQCAEHCCLFWMELKPFCDQALDVLCRLLRLGVLPSLPFCRWSPYGTGLGMVVTDTINTFTLHIFLAYSGNIHRHSINSIHNQSGRSNRISNTTHRVSNDRIPKDIVGMRLARLPIGVGGRQIMMWRMFQSPPGTPPAGSNPLQDGALSVAFCSAEPCGEGQGSFAVEAAPCCIEDGDSAPEHRESRQAEVGARELRPVDDIKNWRSAFSRMPTRTLLASI